jgi:hypothetical protein
MVEQTCVHCGKPEGLHSKYGQSCPQTARAYTRWTPAPAPASTTPAPPEQTVNEELLFLRQVYLRQPRSE